uniref:Glycosyltransferase RgtA/B/C/D-like domain-containing protein n=1 Tax=Ignavibacterium album TaxID=591197 RepID=A0A832G891_9BACT
MKFHINLVEFIRKLNFIKVLFGLGIIVYLMLLVKTAWLCDDSYITFRTVDNFINGYGLRWNVAERVQTYTHPLWMFLISAIYFFTREVFFTSLILSILISLVTVYLMVFYLPKNIINSVLTFIPILTSKAFLDFSTSGLENSLSHLLIATLGIIYIKKGDNDKINLISGFLTALIMLNRMDLILMIIPLLVAKLYNSNKKGIIFFLIGFSPFVLWELFSLWYYGFPFPNTAYAKLDPGISRIELLREGLNYIKESFVLDPVTFITILSALLWLSLSKRKNLIPIGIGIVLYLIYIIFIGGDFMSGRFFTTPFVFSILILSYASFEKMNTIFITILVLLIPFGYISLYRSIYNESHPYWNKIISKSSKSVMDERKFYFDGANLVATLKGKEMPTHYWVKSGRELRKEKQKFSITNNIGFQGYYAGPDCYLIDKLALTDPLRSRLPSKDNWRIGHYSRVIPDGYVESILTNENHILDPDLKKYYSKLTILTRGNLFDLSRLIEILHFNIGSYDYLLESYIKRHNY